MSDEIRSVARTSGADPLAPRPRSKGDALSRSGTGARGRVKGAGRSTRRAPRRRRALLAACALLAALASVAASSLAYSYNDAALAVDERLAAGYLTSRAGLYAAPRVLKVGQKFPRGRLAESLRRAGYVESSGAGAAGGAWSGSFAERDDAVEIIPGRARTDRSGDALGFTPEVVRVALDPAGRVAEITGDGVSLPSFTLEPEPLTADASMKTGRAASLSYDEIPPALARAVIAIEDRRFFEHRGIDPVGVLRALAVRAGLGDANAPESQGGSTITQQLVKNTYLTPERTLARKFREAMLASALERRLPKEDIFVLYCNEIYLGRRGAVGVRGVRQAAQVFFGRRLEDLTLAESATIAGMIQSPARYAPDRHPAESRARRNAVLAAMLRDGAITDEAARSAASEPVVVAPASGVGAAAAPHFVDYVNRVVEARLEQSPGADERALRVHTTIDLELQRLAESAVENQLARLDKIYAKKAGAKGSAGRPEAALVALDARTGAVVAMVGGRDYAASQLNRATDARRQPGSVFKPVVYAAALESGVSPAAMFADAPREFRFDPYAPAYRPSNYGGAFSMRDVTMRDALVRSLNVVTVEVATRVGLARVARLAETFGLSAPSPYPSLALGTAEATPLEIASAYTAFANGGLRSRPLSVARASDAGGAPVFVRAAADAEQVVAPATAYVLTDMLAAVLDHGTARAARSLLEVSAAAGKTGTSRDGWFAGYTPGLVCVVWVGFDDNEPLGLAGADSALPVWQEFMRGALELRPELGGPAFAQPAGVTHVEIDPDTGQLASPACPRRERIAVVQALAPAGECLTHSDLHTLVASLAPGEPSAPSPIPRDARDEDSGPPPGQTLPPGFPAPAARATVAVATDFDGRARLTNDLQTVAARAPRR
jgi:penicillin-binding protein 1B